MAMIKCSECGKEISDKAFTCPNCGNPIKAIKDAQIDQQNREYSKNYNIQIRLYNILAFVIALVAGMELFKVKITLVPFIVFLVCAIFLLVFFKYWIPILAALFIRKYRQTYYQIPKFTIIISLCIGYVFGCGIGIYLYEQIR